MKKKLYKYLLLILLSAINLPSFSGQITDLEWTIYGTLNVLVYNHQLCLINKDVEPNYVKSISDWKNEYAPECDGCKRKSECGGFFASSIKYKYSSNINPFT